jgi:hypothetical protein
MRTCLSHLFFVGVLACTRSGAGSEPGHKLRGSDDTALSSATMTHTDPHDRASWIEARQLALQQKVGEVHKRSDALPFLFSADRAKAVLIHHGAVITQRGLVIAGAYLRDLGVVQGKGPQLDDLLWTLWALDALPRVDPLSPEGYVNVPNNKRLADITARMEFDGQSAHIVLHYFKPEPKLPDDVRLSDRAPRGSPVGGGGRVGQIVRAVVRMTFDIPQTGNAAWRREDVNWADSG